jgi:hypothetical protein
MKYRLERAHPIVIIEDRYGGAYSQGAWFAINAAYTAADVRSRIFEMLESGPNGDDFEAQEFWSEPPNWIAAGHTPDIALDALIRKLAPND